MAEFILAGLNVLLLLILGYNNYLAYKERQILLDRIMAKSLPEYKDNQQPEENDFSDGTENLVDIMDARSLLEKKD